MYRAYRGGEVMGPKLLAVLGTLLAPPAAWQDYRYPAEGFAVEFPELPTIGLGVYRTSSGQRVAATTYSVRQGALVYEVQVVDFSKTLVDDQDVVSDTIAALAKDRDVRLNVEGSIGHAHGRELSLTGKDGGRTLAAVFFLDHRLYRLRGEAEAAAVDAGSGALVRFQQSLQFIR